MHIQGYTQFLRSGAKWRTSSVGRSAHDQNINFLSWFVHQVVKLQSDIAPLHHSLSQLSERNGSLQADKRILEEDLKRWKAKAQVRSVTHLQLTFDPACLYDETL